MKSPGLATVLSALALLGAGAHAQTPSSPPKAAAALPAARETLSRLAAAMTPLRRGDYAAKERLAVLPLLARLRPLIDALEPPAAQAASSRSESWRKLQRIAAEAAGSEQKFWAGFPDPGPDAEQKFPSQTADELKREATEISSTFAELFPEGGRPGRAAAGEKGGAEAAGRIPSRSVQAVARGVAQGGAAADQPERFFDGAQRGGRTGASANAAAVIVHPSAGPHISPRASGLPVEPEAALRVSAVPRLAPSSASPPWRGWHDGLAALNAAAPDALRDAVRSTPVLTGAARGLIPSRAEPPSASPKAAFVPPPPVAQSPETTACLQAVAEHTSVVGMCKSSPTIAPLLAGLLEALEDQFGTVQGLVTNLAYLLLGLVMSALTGFGVIAKIVVSLASFAMLIGTIYPLLKQGYEAVKGLVTTNAGDVRHSRSLLSLGKLGGTVLIMALMAAIGWGVGKSAAGKALMGSTTDAVSGKLADLGLKDGMAALDAKIPPSIKAFLGGPKPAEDASISGFGSALSSEPRPVKSAFLPSVETVARNAGVAEREGKTKAGR